MLYLCQHLQKCYSRNTSILGRSWLPHRRSETIRCWKAAWKILKILACSQSWANHTGTQFPDHKNSLRPALISEVFKLHFMEYLEFIWPFQGNKIEEITVIITVSIVYSFRFNDSNKDIVKERQSNDLHMNDIPFSTLIMLNMNSLSSLKPHK